ncbi:hypothetical protein P171DRAFT_488195 [Karstenula rhodostoma CBS 690.94]|uniref:Uncharacterized protein n=1 Tax=Karstenula rhodostoma CBS 690.94 TaxID=1392251 RepID=A0A9P4PEL8_9PLEO|nr:hypothetical protein P171DRAFT_488195 [Karstenula rhodostoma CBS 690.94]
MNTYIVTTQQNAIHLDDLWTTISAMPEATIHETLFHAAMAEHGAALQARQAEEARIKREKQRVVSFERDVQQIEDWLDDNHPFYFEKRWSTAVDKMVWGKLLPRIAKIKEKGSAEHASLGTKCNALKALISIARALFVNSRGGVGCNVITIFEHKDDNDAVSEAILVTMSQG